MNEQIKAEWYYDDSGFKRDPKQAMTHRSRLSASWRLRLMQFLFKRWFMMRDFDLKDGKPIPWTYEREMDAW